MAQKDQTIDISKEINFDDFIKTNPGIERFLSEAAKFIYSELKQEDQMKKPYVDRSFDDYIIVCGLPICDKTKLETLKKFLQAKIFVKLGIQPRNNPFEKGIYWGWDENKEFTNGCLILDFNSPQMAEEAISGTPGDKLKVGLNGLKFDKQHTLKVFSFSDYSKVFNAPDDFVEPKVLDKKSLHEWQAGNHEHFSYQNGNKVYFSKIFHLNKNPEKAFHYKKDKEEKGINYIELQNANNKIEWSVNGTYLVEFQENGFQLYGGKHMEKLNYFPHSNVKNVEFSSTEEYILSYNGTVLENVDSDNYIVWDLKQASVIRTFKANQDDSWGGMKFNSDGTLIARIIPNQLLVFTLPAMKLLQQPGSDERLPIAVKNIQDFQWVKNSNLICTASYGGKREYDESEIQRNPTKLSLFELPSRRELKWKHISFEISEIQLFSQANGKFIVAVMQKMKNKKNISTLVHVANLQKRNPVEITDKEFAVNEEGNLKSVSFEENTGKLSLVFLQRQAYATKIAQADFSVHLYDIICNSSKRDLKLEQIDVIADQKTPTVQWASNGSFFALVNKDPTSSQQGILELGFLSKNKKFQAQAEVYKKYDNLSYMTNTEWDSTGRLILTGSSDTKSLHIYTALGECLYKETLNKDGLQSLLFRPRNNNFITDKQQAKVDQEIKPESTVWKKWVQEDNKIVNRKAYDEEQKKLAQEKEFVEYMNKKRQLWQQTKQERIKLVGFDQDNFNDVVEIKVVEKEEVVETGIVEK